MIYFEYKTGVLLAMEKIICPQDCKMLLLAYENILAKLLEFSLI